MLRVFLSAFFLFASTFPAFADSLWSCTWCRARGVGAGASNNAAAESPGYDGGGLDGAMTLSVIYPGIVVLMTMTAHFFLKIMEPQASHDNPRFVRGATGLSALWLIGFYPFLTSAIGGFLFCVTAVACTGAWMLIRRYGLQMRWWERAVVFWSFFFFSLLAGLIATGHGPGVAGFFEQSWTATRDAGIHIGPLFMLAINAAALLQVFRIAGIRFPRPADPDSVMRVKVYSLVIVVAIFDTIAAETHTLTVSWVAWPLLALPSLAYYGVYWIVARLPVDVRGRVSFILFTLLALFLVLLACLADGASGATMLLSAMALGLIVSLGLNLAMLWRSGVVPGVKAALSAAVAAVVLGAAYLAFTLGRLPLPDQDTFVRDRLVLGLLGWKSLTGLLLVYGYGIQLFLSPRIAPRARCLLASVMIFFLLFGYAAANKAVPATSGPETEAAISADNR